MSSGSASRRSFSLVTRLLIGTAVSGLCLGAAQAQTPIASDKNNETVVVTGTSIRGAAPTGTDLITVDRGAIEATGAQTIQQVMTAVPQISSAFGSSGQGGQNGDFGGDFVPTIHNIGGGASAATLILIDGHRIPGSGLTVIDTDPSVIPASALQRVEVLPDGASSIYGSDAVAGVINFITRRGFEGLETNVQSGFASAYQSFDGSILWGHNWGSGSILANFDYSSQSQLMNVNRGFLTDRQDLFQGAANPANFNNLPGTSPVGAGGTINMTTLPSGQTIPYPAVGFNNQTFACSPATIAAKSGAGAFYYPYNGTAFSTSTSGVPSQGLCNGNVGGGAFATSPYASALPSETRNNALIEFSQDINSAISIDFEGIYASRVGTQQIPRGTISATAFGLTSANASQINPFYTGNATTGTTSEFVSYDFQDLLGPGAYTKTGQYQLFGVAGLTWKLGDDEIVLSGSAGQDYNSLQTVGAVCTSCAYEALNGTSNSSGNPAQNSLSDIYGNGTVETISRTLTTANALDVWDPASTNKTSAAVRRSLIDGGMFQNANQGLQDFVAKFDGPIFDDWAGPIKIAVGSEFMHQTTVETGTKNENDGPSGSSSQEYVIPLGRQVYSIFAEFMVPIVSPEMNIPLMQKFDLDVSGRWDDYSGGIGTTENPKFAADWTVTDGLKFRGTWGTSFVAPDIHHAGQVGTGFNSEASVAAAGTPALNTIPFPGNGTTVFNGGAGVAGTWVAAPTTCLAGGGVVVNQSGVPVAAPFTGAYGCRVTFGAVQGASQSAVLQINGGNPNLKPATGNSFSVGFDLDFGPLAHVLDGLTTKVTYYDVKYHNLMTSVGTQNGIPQLTTFAPPGGWASTSAIVQNAIAGRPVTISLPPTVWAIFNGTFQNAYNIWQNGLDFEAHYHFNTDDFGGFVLGLAGNEILRASQQVAVPGAVISDVKDGANSGRFPFIEFEGRGTLSWFMDSWSVNLGTNYIHPYMVSTSAFPWNIAGPGRAAGTFHVPAYITGDLNITYSLKPGEFGLPDMATNGVQLALTVQDFTNEDPAMTPTTFGQGSLIGRLITVGLRKSF